MNLDRGSANLSELANLQGVTLPTMSNMVSTLVERGWIQRGHSDADRRMLVVQVTAEGRNVLRRVKRHLADSIAEMLESLSEEDLETLSEGLGLLYRLFPHGADNSSA
jgi:DNA-binding MarR family transcriptional regulator